eukprot:m.43388 g.43388  ORF g.43388 m.43388 type:complete len:348 (+) comp12031_c0_seq1:231-1274(+)
MSQHESRFVSGLRAVSSAVKRSPQIVRKKLGQAATSVRRRAHIGRDGDYSALDDCESNGWLHSDEKVIIGVTYPVKYVGSMEIDYVSNNPQANNQLATEVMEKLKSLKRNAAAAMNLTVSAARIILTRPNSEVVMRHSTSRIAYSTVDTADAKYFCYVALPRHSKIALCHVFATKSAKMSYEMTFTCAQAFNLNYQSWQKQRSNTDLLGNPSEAADVEPANTVRSPEVRRRMMVHRQLQEERARASSLSHTQNADDLDKEHEQQKLKEERKPSVTEANVELNDGDEAVGYIQIDALEIEDEEDIVRSADEYFAHLTQARSEPSLLDIGVEPEQYNTAKALVDSDDDE